MRTPEEIAKIVQVMNGVVKATPQETLEWALLNEERNEAHRLDQIEKDEQSMIASLSGQQRPQWKAPEGFPADMLIQILQGLILTYQQTNASQEVIDAAMKRLDELQGKGKK